MMVNAPLLRKTLEHIESHPQEWNQGEWLCGTTGCFAGHAVLIDGAQLVETEAGVLLRAVPEDNPADVLNTGKERVVNVSHRAQRILGLSRDNARRLFYSENDLDDLRRIVGQLCEGETP